MLSIHGGNVRGRNPAAAVLPDLLSMLCQSAVIEVGSFPHQKSVRSIKPCVEARNLVCVPRIVAPIVEAVPKTRRSDDVNDFPQRVLGAA